MMSKRTDGDNNKSFQSDMGSILKNKNAISPKSKVFLKEEHRMNIQEPEPINQSLRQESKDSIVDLNNSEMMSYAGMGGDLYSWS
jgi:hypothetical protein